MQYIILKVMFKSIEWYKIDKPEIPVLIDTFQKLILHIYFLNVDISIIPVRRSTEYRTRFNDITMKGTVSQIFVLGPTFCCMKINGKLSVLFFLHFFYIS